MTLTIAQVNYDLNENIRKQCNDNFNEIRKIMTPYGEIGEIMYHLFDDVNFWMNNLTGVNYELKNYNDLTTKKEFYDEWTKADKRLVDYFEKSENNIDHKKKIRMVFGSGKEWFITIKDILMHLSHHAFYHRGVLGAVIRINNLPPLPSSNWLTEVINSIKEGKY
ncbi:MAG: DinB family protein [Candidatus Thorarchaeota archaeon]